MNNELIFRLFAPCIPVKGHNRSIICDVFRGRFRYIPNTLYFILNKFKNLTVTEIKIAFENKHDDAIDEYFYFLEEEEFGFYSTKEELKLFPKLNLDFEQPSIITNAIIDINLSSRHNYKLLFQQLGELKCRHWQLRFYDAFSCAELNDILEQRKDTPVRGIHLILKYSNDNSVKSIQKLYDNHPISQIDIHTVPDERFILLKKAFEKLPIACYKTEIGNETHCGKINIDNFRSNIPLFTESQKHNSCLNQKISVDVNGEIKNCPSMKAGFGNTKQTTLTEALEKKGFKDYWSLSKNKIAVCKDCEFRHICTDCRAYVENPADSLSKPLKCGYDPYTNVWEEWSKLPHKQKAIEFYNMKELINA